LTFKATDEFVADKSHVVSAGNSAAGGCTIA
jgi:hypothetical protein